MQILPVISCAVPEGKEEYSDSPEVETLKVYSDKKKKKENKKIQKNLEADISLNPSKEMYPRPLSSSCK